MASSRRQLHRNPETQAGKQGGYLELDQNVKGAEPLCRQLNQLLEKLYPEHPVPAFSGPSPSSP